MEQTQTALKPRFNSWKPWSAPAFRLLNLSTSAEIMVSDLDRNQPLENSCEVGRGQRLLILTVTTSTPNTHRILQNVTEAISSRKGFLNRPEAKELKTVFQEYLNLERSFFESPAEALTDADYQGILLIQNRLYPLQKHTKGRCYIYRGGKLLGFQLIPHQYIQLMPEDTVFLAQEADMNTLVENKAVQKLRQILHTAFSSTSPIVEVEKMDLTLQGPLVMVHRVNTAHRNREQWFQALRQTYSIHRDRLLIGIFLLTWLASIALSYWLKW